MSTTSCPRCSAQVTLPVGVSNDATVRCPLCHAHYTLADALVNMPPLLEVVGDEGDDLAADWLEEPEVKEQEPDFAAVEDADVPVVTALPFDEMDEAASEAETLELGSLELGSLELDDEPEQTAGQETIAEDLGFSTVESPAEMEPLAALPAEDDEDVLGDLGGDVFSGSDSGGSDLSEDELTAGPAEEEDLPLDFGGELSAEDATAETMELSGDSLAGFSESDAGDLKFDLDSNDTAEDADLGATLDFGATFDDKAGLAEPADEDVAGELAFDSLGSEAETVQFDAQEHTFGGDDELKFDDPLAAGETAGEELREFEDLRFEPSDEAADGVEVVPVAPVMAVTPVDAEEAPTGKKGKKTKKKKIKKAAATAEATGDKPKRSLVGILVGVLIAIPAALYGALWLGRDYDLVGLSNYLPAAVLPAEYSKKTVLAQTYVPPPAAAPMDVAPATEEPAEEVPAEEAPTDGAAPAEELPAGDESTAHTTARPATDDPAATGDAMPADNSADVAPSLAEPAEAAPVQETPAEMPADAPAAAATPAEDDLFAPAADAPAAAAPSAAAPPAADDPFGPAADAPAEAATPAADAAADPFGPATDAPAAETPAASAPAEADLFAPAEETPAAPAADTPTDDPFGSAADAPPADAPAEMPAEATPAAPAEDDLFAPATDAPADAAPATEPSGAAEADPFGAAADMPAESPAAPADAPAESDPFGPATEPATPASPPADTTRPAEPDPFAPEPVTPAEEMPAVENPSAPVTDAPAKDLLPAPADVPSEPSAPAEDPLAIPSEPAEPAFPADAPSEPAAAEPQTPTGRVGPRELKPVSPAELTGAMQSAFVANQQLIAAEAAADEAQLRKARAAFYVNLFGMADAITAARQSEGAAELDPQLQQLATILRQQLAADPRRLEALKVFGARWMDFPKRTTDGVVVSGTVESTQQVGPLFHTKARLGNGVDAPVVTIVSSTDPQLASGDTVVALGSIIDQPAQKIAGYQGNDPSVVWSGMAMKVPATN